MFNPVTSTHSWNVLVGGGVKFPTGSYDSTDVFPDRDGNNKAPGEHLSLRVEQVVGRRHDRGICREMRWKSSVKSAKRSA